MYQIYVVPVGQTLLFSSEEKKHVTPWTYTTGLDDVDKTRIPHLVRLLLRMLTCLPPYLCVPFGVLYLGSGTNLRWTPGIQKIWKSEFSITWEGQRIWSNWLQRLRSISYYWLSLRLSLKLFFSIHQFIQTSWPNSFQTVWKKKNEGNLRRYTFTHYTSKFSPSKVHRKGLT